MADEAKRTRRSQRYAAAPERVNEAAERMQAEAGTRGWSAGWRASPGQNTRGYDQQNPPQPYVQQGAGQGIPQGGQQAVLQGGQPVTQAEMDAWYAQEYARQQALMQQQYAAQEYARQQQEYARQQEKQRVASETNSHGAMRGYTTQGAPVLPEGGAGEKKPKKKRVLPILLIALVAVALLAGGGLAMNNYLKEKELEEAVKPYDNLFCYGVYVDGIALGGMTPEQAMNSVQSQIQQRQDAWKVKLTYNGATVAEINANMLGMSVDVAQIMNDAWARGHTPADDYAARYADMQALLENPHTAYTAMPSGDTSVIDGVLAELKTRIDSPSQDAALVAFDTTQSYPFIFQEEVYGLNLDTTAVRDELYRMVATMTGGSVELKPTRVDPNVKVVDLQKHYMLRSSVYTPISTSSTAERNDNIRRAFEFINGYVLQPGAKFSFNSVVGERSEANGFFPAIEYAYGEHVMGIGGGVCQASTTLYQAAVCAGLEIVTRKPHSDAVSYTDYGKDATVYFGSRKKIDLVFKNNTEEPIYMVASVQTDPSNKKRLIAKVTMYGADMGDVRYEIETELVEEIEPPTDPVYIKDKKAEYVTYTDQQKSVSKAQKGYVYNSYRVEYVGNVVNNRVLLYTDTYDAKPERIYVGVTKRPEE